MDGNASRWALMEPRAITVDGDRIVYRAAGEGPLLLLVHGMAGSSETWRHVMPALAERFTGPCARSARAGPIRQTPRRLLARRPCQHAARPAGRPRARAGHRRRPVARGRRGHAVCLSVPGALRAPGPGEQRWAGPGGHVLPPHADRARIRVGLSALLHAAAARRRKPGRHAGSAARACGPRPPARRSGGATCRWRTPRAAAHSFAACAT